MLSDYDQSYLASIVEENQSILDRFAADGVPMNRKVEVTVQCDFTTREQVDGCKAAMRGLEDVTGWKTAGLPDQLIYTTCDYSKTNEGFTLKACFEAEPKAREISVVEFAMMKSAHANGGGEVFWEFADPRNKTRTTQDEVTPHG